MADKRHDDGRVCLCDRPDGTCAGLAVRRLSQDRVRDLAEEIWSASSGDLPLVSPFGDPVASRAGASAQAAYRRHRDQERERWRPGWEWRWLAVAGAVLAVELIGLTVGAWLGWPMAMVAGLLAWSRLRFRLSPGARVWKRQAAIQRRTAAVLGPLAEEDYLVLHDLTLPGWLDSLEQLVVGPTGVWVVASWRRRRLRPGGSVPPAIGRGLRGQAEAVAEVLDGWARVPVRPLLCLHRSWLVRAQPADGLRVAAPSQLPDVVCNGPRTPSGELGRALDRLLAVLRPAA